MCGGGMAPLIPNLGTGCELVAKFANLSFYTCRKTLSAYCVRSWLGSSAYWGVVGEQKNPLPLPGFELLIVHAVV
jgi:hypothetical protein